MDTHHQQMENYFEFVKEVVQKTLELCQTQEQTKGQRLELNQNN